LRHGPKDRKEEDIACSIGLYTPTEKAATWALPGTTESHGEILIILWMNAAALTGEPVDVSHFRTEQKGDCPKGIRYLQFYPARKKGFVFGFWVFVLGYSSLELCDHLRHDRERLRVALGTAPTPPLERGLHLFQGRTILQHPPIEGRLRGVPLGVVLVDLHKQALGSHAHVVGLIEVPPHRQQRLDVLLEDEREPLLLRLPHLVAAPEGLKDGSHLVAAHSDWQGQLGADRAEVRGAQRGDRGHDVSERSEEE
jgi:hypothetical protein